MTTEELRDMQRLIDEAMVAELPDDGSVDMALEWRGDALHVKWIRIGDVTIINQESETCQKKPY